MLTLISILAGWQGITAAGWVERFLVPLPVEVIDAFSETIRDGSLWHHTRVTLVEVIAGLMIGLVAGITIGYAIASVAVLEDLLAPIIILFQATPVVAYAPLLVIWFGSGIESKVITGALVVSFPMLMITIAGVRGVPRPLRDLMRVSRATRWQVLVKLEIPAALPVLLTGLKTSATLSVIGAVIGEFIVARAGLGFMITSARSRYDTPTVFVAVITLAAIAGALYALVSLLERHLLAWQRRTSRY
jgi:NitT/TauT family transport system permease protein